jgi:putative endonuclease
LSFRSAASSRKESASLRSVPKKRIPQETAVTPDLAGNLRLEHCQRVQRDKRYYVYILSSKSRVLYVGMTGFLTARVLQHKAREGAFTCRYHVDRLVYYEVLQYVNNALARETYIKTWRRSKKVALIREFNPTWEDLAADWGTPFEPMKADSLRDTPALRNDKLLDRE